MSSSLLGLPPIPSELKSITAYLQRAEELKDQEPVVAYWCAYYAAQVGIGMKAKEAASRNLLLELLGTLEIMKNKLAGNDIMDIESASAAYVEEFACKVFGSADNEDRSGKATRATAKKFLAASHFLDVLKVFPKADVSDLNEEKSRYAKWKAADIAKAFREGRKPTLGPPGGEEHEDSSVDQTTSATSPDRPSITSPIDAKSPLQSSSPHSVPPPQLRRDSPPRLSPEQISPPNPASLVVADDATPGSWSTIATPGAPAGDATPGTWSTAATPGDWHPGHRPSKSSSPLIPRQRKHSSAHQRSRSGSSATKKSVSPPSRPPADLENDPAVNANAAALGIDKRAVHFNPSLNESTESIVGPTGSAPPLRPSVPSAPPHKPSAPRAQPSAPPAPEPDLTPALVLKVQKHCRFAISALDYEDAETAKRELRAALQALGG